MWVVLIVLVCMVGLLLVWVIETSRSEERDIMAKKAAKKPKLGTGARFKKLTKGGASPALAAYIGRKKWGAKRMAKMSAAGRKRRSK